MRMVGFAFREASSAEAAERLLTDRFDLERDDVWVARLVSGAVLLGVRTAEEQASAVHELLRTHGGEALVEFDVSDS